MYCFDCEHTNKWNDDGESSDSKQSHDAVQVVDETVCIWNKKLRPDLQMNGPELMMRVVNCCLYVLLNSCLQQHTHT